MTIPAPPDPNKFDGDDYAIEVFYPSHVVITRTQRLMLPVKSEVPLAVIRNIMGQILMREAGADPQAIAALPPGQIPVT
jgi:hypothetical protein